MSRISKPMGLVLALAVFLALCLIATASLADRKPSRSKPADPQFILAHFAGKTWDWSEGGSYWGSGGNFEAIWKEGYATGKWYVTTKATLCYEANWTSKDPQSGQARTGDVLKLCWQHVVDRDGQVWQRNHEKNDWYRLNADKVSAGNQVARDVKKLRKRLGI